MIIYVDADACPKVIKEILIKASSRTKKQLIFVANAPIPIPVSTLVRLIQVEKGIDSADTFIANVITANDLLITADIHLAFLALNKKAFAINPNGLVFDKDSIKMQLNMRDLNEHLRTMGERTSRHAPFGEKEKKAFANALDKYLAKA
jgi:uncharacterized protein YaiI (UPF0178 family)